jgi:hypothetical protein
MPLQDQKSSSAYVKVSKIYISNSDRREDSKGQYDYIVDLPQQIQYVIGLEVTAYRFPGQIAPTFVPASGIYPGTNKVDFLLRCINGTLWVEQQFSFTWPLKQYNYETYTEDLIALMYAAVQSDPFFGTEAPNRALFFPQADPDSRTSIVVDGLNMVGMRFLFETGPNQNNSSYYAMGFDKLDTPFFTKEIISPITTRLRPFRYVDINIDEAAEFKPLRRIYVEDNFNNSVTRNEIDATRTRLLSSQPIRNLKRLHIRINLENGLVPPDSPYGHDFTLTVFSVANEITVQKWIKQVFVL